MPTGRQIAGQLMMMLTMVAYTFTGLYLLFGGYRRQFFGCRSGKVNVGKPASPRAPRIISVLARGGWPGREIHGGSVAPGLAE